MRAAGLAGLAEVAEQPHAPAVGRLGQPEHGIELGRRQPLVRDVGLRQLDQPALLHDVGQAVGHPGLGRLAIAAGAAGLLEVAFDALGHVEVRDEAHVGLVDAHAEGDRGHHHERAAAVLAAAQEGSLVAGAQRGLHAGVIRQRGHAVLVQEGRHLLDRIAGQAVDDAGLARMLVADEAQQLLARLALLDDPVADVGPVEAGHEHPRAGEQPLLDLQPRRRIGGGGQRDARHLRKALAQQAELAVLGAEVVAPLRHAVRLVDREQRQPALRLHVVEQPQAALAQQPFGRDVDEVELAGAHPALDRRRLGAAQCAVEKGRAHAQLGQRGHLVLHQCDQRRDHHAHAMPHQCRDLVGQRLAAAGGHQHQRVAAAGHVLDHLALETAEGAVAEHLGEDRGSAAQVVRNGVHRPERSEIGAAATVRRNAAAVRTASLACVHALNVRPVFHPARRVRRADRR